MKKLLTGIAMMVLVVSAMGQDIKDTSKMAQDGQSGNSEESRYVLGLVRNDRADLLNKYFDAAPWKIQTEIDAYTDSEHVASVGVFCVAVDLGYIDVVKAFVEHGYGPADLCRVQHFTTKRVVVSKAEFLLSATTTATSESQTSSHQSSQTTSRGWFGARKSNTASSSSSARTTTTVRNSVTAKYSQVFYGDKKVTKTYFANPLDFASDEMFDYLWEQGFRSNNLFTEQALAEARATGRTEVWEYILSEPEEILKNKPSYISEQLYRNLLETLEKDPNSLAAALIEKSVLGKIETRAQADAIKQQVEREMQNRLAAGNDTTGFAQVNQALRKQGIKVEEARKAAERRQKQALERCGYYKTDIYRYGDYYYIKDGRIYTKYDLDGYWKADVGEAEWHKVTKKGVRIR